MNNSKNYGFTLIELLVAVAILAVLASVAVYSIKGSDKISEAEAVVLKQALISYVPEQIKRYYLRGDSAAWAAKVSEIASEMTDWPLLQNTPLAATVYKDNGIELKFATVYLEQEKNEQLHGVLSESPMIESVTIKGPRKQRFTVKYKLN